MKRFFAFFILALYIISVPALAASGKDPGVTPKSAMWGLDKAADSVAIALAFTDESKTKKRLAVAAERLAELESMVEEEEFDAADKAQAAHKRLLDKVEQADLSTADVVEELGTVTDVEAEILAQRATVERLKLKITGTLTAEQQERLDALLASLSSDVEEVEIVIKGKKDRVKIKVREEREDADEVLESAERDVWPNKAEKRIAQAEHEILKAEERIARFEERYDERLAKADARAESRSETRTLRDQTRPEPRPERSGKSDNSLTGMVSGSDSSDSEDESGESDSQDAEEAESEQESDETENEDDAEPVETELEQLEAEDDGYILTQYNLSVVDPQERGVEVAKRLLEQAKGALGEAKSSLEPDPKRAYAYATFAKKLAQRAQSGKFLRESDEQKDAVKAREEAAKDARDAQRDVERNTERERRDAERAQDDRDANSGSDDAESDRSGSDDSKDDSESEERDSDDSDSSSDRSGSSGSDD